MHPIFTLGHSNHDWPTFISFLTTWEIGAVADVRSSPFSSRSPQYIRENLKTALRRHGLYYAFLGAELGGRSDDPADYDAGQVSYDRIANSERFHRGLARVRKGMQNHRVVLLCAEREPLECHRTLLVCRQLRDSSIDIGHILPNGDLEKHDQTEKRLLDVTGVHNHDIFATPDQLLAKAYEIQSRRFAHTVSLPLGKAEGVFRW
jgi:uncharacterized protein (DUF488 family)